MFYLIAATSAVVVAAILWSVSGRPRYPFPLLTLPVFVIAGLLFGWLWIGILSDQLGIDPFYAMLLVPLPFFIVGKVLKNRPSTRSDAE